MSKKGQMFVKMMGVLLAIVIAAGIAIYIKNVVGDLFGVVESNTPEDQTEQEELFVDIISVSPKKFNKNEEVTVKVKLKEDHDLSLTLWTEEENQQMKTFLFPNQKKGEIALKFSWDGKNEGDYMWPAGKVAINVWAGLTHRSKSIIIEYKS